MPNQYLIKITGVISWEGQYNGLPKEMFAFILYNGDDTETINKHIEEQMASFIRAQMMFAQRDQGAIIDVRMTPQDRIAVPFRWIVYFYATVDKLTGELSEPDEKGVERLADGTEPVKQ